MNRASNTDLIQASHALISQREKQLKKVCKVDNETQEVKDYPRSTTLTFQDNHHSDFTVQSPCIKVLIDGCKDCTIRLNGAISTEMVEVWNSENVIIHCNTSVKTLLADMCGSIQVNYPKREFFGQLIWAGVSSCAVQVGDDSLESGVAHVDRDRYHDFREQYDQFVLHYVDGTLMEEIVVRLENGFPTTDREADAFDRQKEKNDAMFEKYVRDKLASELGPIPSSTN